MNINEHVIVGGGCIGASIFHAMVKAGVKDVTLVDHGNYSLSATAHSGGMNRVFHENPQHVELAIHHYRLYNNFINHQILKEKIFPNGSLYFFSKERLNSILLSLNLMESADYPYEIISEEEGAERFPDFCWNQRMAIFEPMAFTSDPVLFSKNLIEQGVSLGGKFIADTEVIRICRYLNHFRISTHRGVINGRKLIMAGGARMIPLLHQFGLHLNIQPKTLEVIRARFNIAKKLPSYFDRETLSFAGFGSGSRMVFSNDDQVRLKSKIWDCEKVKIESSDCYAPERMGVLGSVAGSPDLYVATGWGGTAYKFSLAVGDKMAQMISDRQWSERNFCASI